MGRSVVVVVVVSHIQRIGCPPEKVLYTVDTPARGLLNKHRMLYALRVLLNIPVLHV